MKTLSSRKRVLALVFFLVSMTALVIPTSLLAAWPTAAATLCWSVGGGHFIQSRITPMGSRFFNLNSIIVYGGKVLNVELGTAYVRGNYVYETTMATGKDSTEIWATFDRIVLNKNTLVGQFEGIVASKNFAGGDPSLSYEKGAITLKPVSCSSIWQ